MLEVIGFVALRWSWCLLTLGFGSCLISELVFPELGVASLGWMCDLRVGCVCSLCLEFPCRMLVLSWLLGNSFPFSEALVYSADLVCLMQLRLHDPPLHLYRDINPTNPGQ